MQGNVNLLVLLVQKVGKMVGYKANEKTTTLFRKPIFFSKSYLFCFLPFSFKPTVFKHQFP